MKKDRVATVHLWYVNSAQMQRPRWGSLKVLGLVFVSVLVWIGLVALYQWLTG